MAEKVLIVDDDDYIRMITKTMLLRSGYTVEAVNSGEDALLSIRKNGDNTACIILDLTMPGLSGEETLKKIREIDKELPVLISSGFMEEEIREKFSPGEISGILKKPFQIAGLISSVKKVISENHKIKHLS